MKTRLAVVLTALACLLAASVASRAAVDVSFSAGIEISSQNDFYEPLTPYGEWVSVGSYGRCWHPIDVEVGWRPYCEGHWEWTDCGWYWVSDEPWSWATYHYGSWIDDPNYGWCWIPGTEWAPSWVTWREAPDYIGWAPCGPGGAVLAPSLFVFVDVHHFSQPIRPHTVIVNNTTIINRTRVINDIRRVDRNFEGSRRRVVINEGPKVDVVARATGRTFTAKPVTEIVRQTPVPEHIKRTGTIERPVLKEDRQKIEQRKREHNTGAAQERQRTPSPTGREQPDNRQQPEHQRPEQVRPEQPPTHNAPNRQEETRPQERDRVAPQQPNSPTGREQPRVAPSEQHPLVPQRPEQHPTPNTPEHRNQPQQPNHVTPERAVPPSGQVRPEQHPTSNAPEHRDQVQPQQPNRVTPERPTPPTGREQPHVSPPEEHPSVPQRPEQARPEQHATPPTHQPSLPPTGREQPHVSTPSEQHTPVPRKPEQVRPEHPTPQVPPERAVPPTGREVPKEQPHHEQPAVHQQPSVKEVPQPQHERPATPPSQERSHSQEKKDHPE